VNSLKNKPDLSFLASDKSFLKPGASFSKLEIWVHEKSTMIQGGYSAKIGLDFSNCKHVFSFVMFTIARSEIETASVGVGDTKSGP